MRLHGIILEMKKWRRLRFFDPIFAISCDGNSGNIRQRTEMLSFFRHICMYICMFKENMKFLESLKIIL